MKFDIVADHKATDKFLWSNMGSLYHDATKMQVQFLHLAFNWSVYRGLKCYAEMYNNTKGEMKAQKKNHYIFVSSQPETREHSCVRM